MGWNAGGERIHSAASLCNGYVCHVAACECPNWLLQHDDLSIGPWVESGTAEHSMTLPIPDPKREFLVVGTRLRRTDGRQIPNEAQDGAALGVMQERQASVARLNGPTR